MSLLPWSEARRDGDVWEGRGEQAAGVGQSDRDGFSSLVGEILHRVGEVEEENCGEAVVVRLEPSWLEALVASWW